jgi:shikimate kinase
MGKNNVILIGMPGVGKSTIGVLLAKALKMPFLDTDLLIQQNEGKYLQEIIDSSGIDSFLRLEEAVVLSLETDKHVIATGGSVIYSPASMEHLKSIGTVFYLRLKLSKLKGRLRKAEKRGIVMKQGQSLFDLFRERAPLYEKYADIVIDCSHKHIDTIVNEIKNHISP